MDAIEACMLSKGDIFRFAESPDKYKMIGWHYNLDMPIVAPVTNIKNERLIYPFRIVYVDKFYY